MGRHPWNGGLRWRTNPSNGGGFSDRNGDGVLREENTMRPKLTIAHMQVDCWCLNDCVGKPDAYRGRLLNSLKAIQDP